jgi:hypothetical protein
VLTVKKASRLKVESREEIFFSWNMLKLKNGRKWLLMMILWRLLTRSFLLAGDAADKNDDKSQVTGFLFLFKGVCAKGRSGSLCMYPTVRCLQQIKKKVPAFGFQPRCLL